jgi:hypothetical protein
MSYKYLDKNGLSYFWSKLKAKIGTATLTTTSQDLSGAVNELNSKIADIKSISIVEASATTGGSGNISTPTSTTGKVFIFAPYCTSSIDVYLRAWRASSNDGWYLTAVNPNTGATVNNTSITYRYIRIEFN